MTKKVICLILALMMVLSLCACGGSESAAETKTETAETETETKTEAASGEKVLNIAWVGPVTGPASRAGEELYNGFEMRLDAIDWKIGDYTLQVFKVDSESDAEKAAVAYEECIINNDIDVGFNTWHSWVSASCIEVSAKYEIPHLLTFGASDAVIEKVNSDYEYYKYWAGKTWPQPIHLVQAYVDCIANAMEAGTFAPAQMNLGVYGVDEDWGRTFAKAGKEGFEAQGWTTVVEEYVAIGTTDYYAILNKMKDAGVTLALGTMSDANAATSFIKQSAEVGLEALIICDGLGWIGEWYELTGEASNYVLESIPQFTTEAGQQFVADFTERYGYAPGPANAGLAYDTAGMFLKVLQVAYDTYGELNNEIVMQCWEEKVMTGELTFSMDEENGAIMVPCYDFSDETMYPDPIVDAEHYIFPVVQYFDGQGVGVYPENMAEQELKVPETWG